MGDIYSEHDVDQEIEGLERESIRRHLEVVARDYAAMREERDDLRRALDELRHEVVRLRQAVGGCLSGRPIQ